MSWFQDVLRVERMFGNELVVPTPLDLAAIWQRGVQAGLKLGTLTTVAQPLSRRAGGSYDGATGDVWMLMREDADDSRRTLFHELGHAQQNTEGLMVVPSTIEQDWEQEADAWRRAAALAAQWGYSELFPAAWLLERLSWEGRFCEWCIAAGDLVGSADPFIARAAIQAAFEVAHDGDQPWEEDRFEAALYGYSDADADVAKMALLNRWAGRGSFSFGHIRDGNGFGESDVGDDAREQAASWLLDALRRQRAGVSQQVEWTQRTWGASGPAFVHLGLLTLDGDEHLPAALQAIRWMLMEQMTERSITAYATAYGDGSGNPRVYRIEAHYSRVAGEDEPPQSDLYILVPGNSHRTLKAEAALQLYLLGWKKGMAYRHAGLAEGLRLFWSLLGGRL